MQDPSARKRFGGTFSPEGGSISSRKASPKRRVKQGLLRNRLLFFIPLPLLFMAFGKAPDAMIIDCFAACLLLLAAWLLQEGIKAQEAYEARTIARRPAFPRKICASILTGIGLALASLDGLNGLLVAPFYGVLAAGLHSFAFGLDPLKSKGFDEGEAFQADRVARAISQGEVHLTEMNALILSLADRSLLARFEQFSHTARAMFSAVEQDPRDLSAARKFMGIYLVGAKDATAQFVQLYQQDQNTTARQQYIALLDDLERSFNEKRGKLLDNDQEALNIEIDVLRDRLKRDGLLK